VTAAIRARVRTVASRVLPPGVKRGLKRLVRAYHQRFLAFTPADLPRVLLQLGVLPGDVASTAARWTSFGHCRRSSDRVGRS